MHESFFAKLLSNIKHSKLHLLMVGSNSALTEEKDDNQQPSDTRKVFEILITSSR